MSDIVERLEAVGYDQSINLINICREAKAEIERLRARARELEQALSQAGDSIELQEAEQRGFERAREWWCNDEIRQRDAEMDRLRAATTFVVETFQKDEAHGYRSRDRQFAIEILSKALERPKTGG